MCVTIEHYTTAARFRSAVKTIANAFHLSKDVFHEKYNTIFQKTTHTFGGGGGTFFSLFNIVKQIGKHANTNRNSIEIFTLQLGDKCNEEKRPNYILISITADKNCATIFRQPTCHDSFIDLLFIDSMCTISTYTHRQKVYCDRLRMTFLIYTHSLTSFICCQNNFLIDQRMQFFVAALCRYGTKMVFIWYLKIYFKN